MSDTLSLDGRSVLVTGAGGALGQALTRKLVSANAVVIMLDRNLTALESLYDELENVASHKPVIVEADMATFDESMGNELANQISANLGHLDALIHCATHLAPLTPMDHARVADFDKQLAVNVRAPWLLTRACLPLMQTENPKEPRRSIIFSLSNEADTHRAFWSSWTVTTNGLNGLIPVLADELENRGVNVYGIDPGEFQSAWQSTAFPGRKLQSGWSAEEAATLYAAVLHGLDSSANPVTSGSLIKANPRH